MLYVECSVALAVAVLWLGFWFGGVVFVPVLTLSVR